MKIRIIKYSNLSNYFDTKLVPSELEWLKPINGIYLKNTNFDNYQALYWKWEYYDDGFLGRMYRLSIYTDSARTNLLTTGSTAKQFLEIGSGMLNESSFLNEHINKVLLNDGSFFLLNAAAVWYLDRNGQGIIENIPKTEDTIELTKLPFGFIQGFDEELFNIENRYVSSDFTLNLSLLTKTLSTNGIGLKDFLRNNNDNVFKVEFYNNNNELKKIGFIDYSSIDFNNNLTDDGKYVNFNVFESIKEYLSFLSTLKYYWLNAIGTLTTNLRDIIWLTGMDYIFSYNIDDTIFNSTGKHNTNIEKLQIFKDYRDIKLNEILTIILKISGGLFKLNWSASDNNFNKPTFELFNLDNTSYISNLKVLDDKEGNSGIYGKYYIGIKLQKIDNLMLPQIDKDAGVVIYFIVMQDIDGNMISEYFAYKPDEKCYYRFITSGGWEDFIVIQEDEIIFIDIPLKKITAYDPKPNGIDSAYRVTDVTFLSGFSTLAQYGWGLPYDDDKTSLLNIANSLFKDRYLYQLNNLKKIRNLTVVYNTMFNLILYNKVNYDSLNWYIQKINDVDIQNKTCKVKLIEI